MQDETLWDDPGELAPPEASDADEDARERATPPRPLGRRILTPDDYPD